MPSPAEKLDPYAAWRRPDYRRFAVSWFLLVFSWQIEMIAIADYLAVKYSMAEASFLLAMVGLVRALPVMLLAIAGGQLADRFDRRKVMICSYSLGIVVSVCLMVVAYLQASDPWIFVLLGLGAIGGALGNPSRQALLPGLVPVEILPNAIMWSMSVFQIASITGPLVGGAIMWLVGTERLTQGLIVAFSAVLLCRLTAIGNIPFIRAASVDRSEQTISWQSVVAGIRFVWRTKLILATITLDLFAVLFGGLVYLLPVYAEKILDVGGFGLGCLRAADGVGAICMSIFLAHQPPMKRAGVTLLWSVAGFGVYTIVFGFSDWFWLSLLAMFFIGAFDNISVVVRHTLVQMLTPDEMRGRVSAVNGVFISASNDLGGVESGLASWLFTPVISVVGGGIGAILVVLGVMKLWPQITKIGSLHSIQPADLAEPSEEAS
jgi:MFS family permease